jgi:hypothetical protein
MDDSLGAEIRLNMILPTLEDEHSSRRFQMTMGFVKNDGFLNLVPGLICLQSGPTPSILRVVLGMAPIDDKINEKC